MDAAFGSTVVAAGAGAGGAAAASFGSLAAFSGLAFLSPFSFLSPFLSAPFLTTKDEDEKKLELSVSKKLTH